MHSNNIILDFHDNVMKHLILWVRLQTVLRNLYCILYPLMGVGYVARVKYAFPVDTVFSDIT